ncbi:MAG: hypothetical protein IKH11_05690 [Bacteroidales bacterium]|nr:hypothetical protein [Bacteroidales bacterium]
MKKLYALLTVAAVALCASVNSGAVEEPDAKGTVAISAYAAPKFIFGASLTSHAIRVHWGTTFAATGDYVITNNIWKGHLSVGLALGGYVCPKMALDSGAEFRSAFSLAPRVTYGLNLTEHIEVHAGFSAGPYLHTEQVYYTDGTKEYASPTSISFATGVIVGFRYFLSQNFALAAEVDTQAGLPTLGLGATFKF